jgi:hypothetical protein
MLRIALSNATRSAARPILLTRQARPAFQVFARYESSKANEALKAARKAKDKLQKDWQGPVLTYEQVKPKTISPGAVRLALTWFCAPVLSLHPHRMHI